MDYLLDPENKVTIVRRIGDDFDPQCNQYRSVDVTVGPFGSPS